MLELGIDCCCLKSYVIPPECRDMNGFCDEHPDVVMLCTSILSTASVLRSLPVERLKGDTLFVDVLSVKEFAKQLFLSVSLFEPSQISVNQYL